MRPTAHLAKKREIEQTDPGADNRTSRRREVSNAGQTEAAKIFPRGR